MLSSYGSYEAKTKTILSKDNWFAKRRNKMKSHKILY